MLHRPAPTSSSRCARSCLPTVSTAIPKTVGRDPKLAGVPKKDARGWTVDVHVMRHSSLDLTMNVYTDPQLLDVAGALDALPELPLPGERTAAVPGLRPTGTNGVNVGR
jgi:hypothetical protein